MEGKCILPKCGHNVSIRNDPWLPNHPNKRPVWRVADPRLQVVIDLVHRTQGIWDQDLIQASFNNDSARCILQLPAPRPDGHDQLIWASDAHGLFSIKSAIHLNLKRCPPNMLSRDKLWQQLWKFNTQDRLKLLL
ncbi:hypothetical protein CJ030_MR7G016734 [Morella rubra]|uniref:Uncharacterized protein n=1 Tax=Morella rubra TaxID=262757 RepID=A0A6A1V1B0_9ROSI|nr:hypothetical protein CJ030_MR7G016734 [Morella rubra]